jgi:cysteine desulfurase
MKVGSTIYLDHLATTPCDPRVVEVMLPYFTERFGNPSSAHHALGRASAQALDAARESVGALIGCPPDGVFFTSGATESNNLALFGIARGLGQRRRKLVTTAVEHKAVLAPAHALEREGFELVVLPVDGKGRVDLDTARAAIDHHTLLVSVQAANNETGTLQPVAELAALAHQAGALIHSDATQMAGKLPFSMDDLDLDLISISAHKLYGPKGVGALCIADARIARHLVPLLFGGNQQAGLRSGTENVPGNVGFGKACELAIQELAEEAARIQRLRDDMEARILAGFEGATVNGDRAHRLPGASNITLPAVDAEELLARLPQLALSTTSACVSGTQEPSHVLVAMGLTRERAYQSIRISPGRFTTYADTERAADLIIQAARCVVQDAKQHMAPAAW